MNISSLKTPGVYIDEIDAFPPSVAQVATAIPAFIGYTEKKPTSTITPIRISSMVEFEQRFGGAPSPANITVKLDTNNQPTDACTVTESKYKLYYSMQLFFANGGGECYIVSIGTYSDNPTFANANDFTAGLKTLEKEDEPTLILFPDAINLAHADLGTLQKTALLQCGDLMDRFVIMDVKQEEDQTKVKSVQDFSFGNFRGDVGSLFLKYGAAYYPYLQTNFTNQFRFIDINNSLIANTPGDMKQFFGTSDDDEKIKNNIKAFVAMDKSISDLKGAWKIATKTFAENDKVTDAATTVAHLKACWDLLAVFGRPDLITNAGFQTYFDTEIIQNKLLQYAKKLANLEAAYNSLEQPDKTDPKDTAEAIDALALVLDKTKYTGNWGDVSTRLGTADGTEYKTIIKEDKTFPKTKGDGSPDVGTVPYKAPAFDAINTIINKILLQIVNAADSAISSIDKYEAIEENNLIAQIPVYPSIIAKLNKSMNTIPPSGAIAGVYAQTDANRGVWKSPANVSLNLIIGLTDDVNDKEQETMNIHESGKSINAIRKFSGGRGILVWGGRTLDGNSNDWRYINVRRLANMIEESVKKACMRYVFEPNVAQTWVNVKGMIENYLTNLWNDGALAGAKPEHAFFVAVGLNQTMTAQDILEGRMVVKVGYCPSRPAEFIILEFKQMQQKS